MTRRHTLGAATAALVIASGAFAVRGSAQAQQASGPDVLPALLQEVRGLRAAMEQMATSNAHAQLLVGRLQLQEGRMTSMIHRLDTVRDEKAKAQREYEQIRGSLRMLDGDRPPNDMPDRDREQLLAGIKHEVDAAKANVDRLAAEETQLTSDLAAEQGRWIEINQRLDELERALAKR
jgi:chromosome segregation ATPase